MSNLNLFSIKIANNENRTSAVRTLRLPVNFILKLHSTAKARKVSFNALANECLKRGYEQLESEVNQKQAA